MIKYITQDRGSYYFNDRVWQKIDPIAAELSALDLIRYSDYALDTRGDLIKCRLPIECVLDAALLD